MVKLKKGHILNVCSTAGHEVYPNGNVYSSTKYAVDALTKSIRLDLYKHGIRVSQISPGMVEETEFAKVRFDGDAKKASIYEDFNPLTSKDVAEIVLFMVTRKKHINIQDILVMGTQQASSNFVDRSGRTYE
jgi:NADP-dependent 3-hydroxy acid dehydrogenase YdfG